MQPGRLSASHCTAPAAGMLGPTMHRPGEAALVAAVLGTGAAQKDLVPALMRCYAAADHVVGLDVDKVGLGHMLYLLPCLREEQLSRSVCRADQPEQLTVLHTVLGKLMGHAVYAMLSCQSLVESWLERSRGSHAALPGQASSRKSTACLG